MQQIYKKPFESTIYDCLVKGNMFPCYVWIYSSPPFSVIASAASYKIVLGSEVARRGRIGGS